MTQENWISAPNKHIEEYLDYYFDGKKNFEYAVLLNGAWGSGNAYSCINVPPILVRTVPAISVPNVPLAIFKEYWD